jgi:hypothetical protein
MRIEIVRRRLAGGEELAAFRIVRTDDREAPAFVESFRSRTALGLPPRTWTQEGSNPEIADGISAFRTATAAAATARAAEARGRGFGNFVAELRLSAATDVEIAEWGSPGHLTIWGDALMLSHTATDIVPIEP